LPTLNRIRSEQEHANRPFRHRQGKLGGPDYRLFIFTGAGAVGYGTKVEELNQARLRCKVLPSSAPSRRAITTVATPFPLMLTVVRNMLMKRSIPRISADGGAGVLARASRESQVSQKTLELGHQAT